MCDEHSAKMSSPHRGGVRGGLFFIFCKGDILLTKEGTVPFGNVPPVELKPWEEVTTLGDISVASIDKPVTDRDDLQMMPLRKSFHVLSAEDYRLAGKCAELVYFHQNNKFCGVCGGEMRWQTEISKQCRECGKELWPSLATAVIVRIRRGDKILMVHAHSFRDRHYGLVAGFVETGETLEDCVRREVMEETGITVTNIRYFSSQPWPYPSGLMVGFTADWQSGEIALQKTELSDGGWFSRDNLPSLPDPSSIAYRLIMDWVHDDECPVN